MRRRQPCPCRDCTSRQAWRRERMEVILTAAVLIVFLVIIPAIIYL